MRILPSRNDWFLRPETEPLMRALSRIRGDYYSVTTYGFSMGGFAAFLFAGAVGADRVLAVSPQYSIDRALCPFGSRWEKEAAQLEMQGVDVTGFCPKTISGAIVVDPKVGKDWRHAKMFLSAFPRVAAIRFKGGGHPATKIIREHGRVSDLGRALLRGRPAQEIEEMHAAALARAQVTAVRPAQTA